MIHVITGTDLMAGRELRRIEWDDEAGTVGGDHSDVPWLAERLAQEPPVRIDPSPCNSAYVLQDPRHDAADFMVLLRFTDPLRAGGAVVNLPPPLRNVTPTPPLPDPPAAPGTVY